MKKIFLGFIVFASAFSIYAQSCGQAASLIKVRAEVGKVAKVLNPINAALLDSSGELKNIFYDFQNSSFISEEFNASIDDFDDNKVNVGELGSGITNYVSRSLKECVKVDELLQVVDSLEKISTSRPHYKAFLNKIIEELAVQKHYMNLISQDIKKVENGSATDDEISTFLERYMGNNLEIALYHANDYLVDIKKNTSALNELSNRLDTEDIDEKFNKVESSLSIATEKTFEALELSGI